MGNGCDVISLDTYSNLGCSVCQAGSGVQWFLSVVIQMNLENRP